MKNKGIIDKDAFRNMKHIDLEHKKLIMEHLKKFLININEDKLTIDNMIYDAKGILISLSNLKKHYKNER